jgi:16S rRNA processing protein RimM
MRIDDCYQLGYVTKAHGLHGEVRIFLDVDFPEAYNNLESVLVAYKNAPQTLVPFFIDSFRLSGNTAIVRFEDMDTIDEAEALKEAQLYLPLETLPKLQEGQFYYHEVIGYTVVDQEAGQLGTIREIYALAGQDVIAMEYQGKEVLIPVNDDIVHTADHALQLLHVQLPNGLLDIYLEG